MRLRTSLSSHFITVFMMLGLLMSVINAYAADHTDSPLAQADPAADINDFYVFRSTDSGDPTETSRTVFVMTVFPFAEAGASFSDAIDYEFVILDLDTETSLIITCNLADGQMGCTGSNGAVAISSDGSDDDPLRLQAEPMIMHAGLTDDPFFFDLTDFLTVYSSTDPSVLLDASGVDTFAGANVLSIVVDVHQSQLPGTNLAVWARTVRQGN